ncbi:MAG: hypothetical protein AUG49_26120 [Catenulispora sp. 13_1_20CM_3_70_7]|nr:MAG: hypothetical protein AUG49_26120 [Catenulispora sp. 13_1_20CM_3_70_7]
MSEAEFYFTSRIPRDIDRPDQVVGPLSFRQLAIVAGTGAVCWLAFEAIHMAAPAAPILIVAAPLLLVLVIAAGIALGTRDGIPADRFLLAALAYARRPRRLVSAPNGVLPVPSILPAPWRKAAGPPPSPLRLPARGVDGMGVIDLAEQGTAGVAACSTVNFALRSAGEQNGLVGAFGRFLNALTGPTQILIAARDHAAFLAELSETRQLLARQVLLAAREPAAGKHAGAEAGVRIGRRLAEAASVLSGAQITVAAYTPAGAADLLTDAIAGHTPTGVAP